MDRHDTPPSFPRIKGRAERARFNPRSYRVTPHHRSAWNATRSGVT